MTALPEAISYFKSECRRGLGNVGGPAGKLRTAGSDEDLGSRILCTNCRSLLQFAPALPRSGKFFFNFG